MAQEPQNPNITKISDTDSTATAGSNTAGSVAQSAVVASTNGASSADSSAVPAWLKAVEEKNKQMFPDQVQAQNDSSVVEVSPILKNVLALKEHEEKAQLDDKGNVVLNNLNKPSEKTEAELAEEQLAQLDFEGLEDKKVEEVKVIPIEEKKLEVIVENKNATPDWLNNLDNKSTDSLVVPTSVEAEKIVEPELAKVAIVEEVKPVVEVPAVTSDSKAAPDWLKGLSNEPVVSPIETLAANIEKKQDAPKLPENVSIVNNEEKANAVVATAVQTKIQQKENVFASLSKGLFGAAFKAKKEIDLGKAAGVDEANITLENFELAKSTTGLPKTAAAKSKDQIAIEERRQLIESEKIFQEGMATVRDLIAPSSMEINYDSIRVEGMFARTFIVYSYPRYLETNWLSPIVNFDATMDIAQFIYPIDSAKIMKVLQSKVTQMQSSMSLNQEKGMIRDPALETAYEDAEQMRTEIQRGQEKFFQFAMYITVYADELKKIDRVSKQLESILGSKLILTKRADLRMEHGFNSTTPLCLDELEIFRNMNTGPLSTTFPFSSSDLTSNEGILYGLNRHNDSLVIFDRFSLPNANSVCFAISGAGKSYTVKLEILRYLMLGVDVIVIDPENEYEELAQTVGGSYLKVSLTSDRRINPFDLPSALKDAELQPGDLLRSNIITLHGLLKLMLGGLTAGEEGIIDKALNDVYALKGITMEMLDPSNMPMPTMEDLHALLLNMEGGNELAQRLEKYTKGTYSGIFNKPTNVDMKSGLMIFSIRDLEDALRPIAMYIILNFIWNRVRSSLKKRLMIVDEAWTMMQHEDSARFLFGLVKRARKYYLGITTITQDVEDFIKSPYGKPIVTNSSMQMLMKQSPASINILQKVFNLTEGEKYMLLNSGVGQGLFFAGAKHVAIQVIASYMEDKIVTTDPEEILRGLENKAAQNYE